MLAKNGHCKDCQRMGESLLVKLRALAVPKKWRGPFAILSMMAALGIAVSDFWFLWRFFDRYGRNVPIAFYRPGLYFVFLGVPFCWFGFRGPRLSAIAFPLLFLSLCTSIFHGLDLTDPSYLDRPGTHFPLEDYPWSFQRLGSFGAMIWLAGFAVAGWAAPYIWRRLDHATRHLRRDGKGK